MPPLRLPKPARLGLADEFARVKSDGTTFASRYFVLAVLRNASAGERARVGIITSRRVGNSVVRHRVRRRLRELFRLSRPLLRPGLWLVLIARAAAASATYAALAAEWERLGRKACIFLETASAPVEPVRAPGS